MGYSWSSLLDPGKYQMDSPDSSVPGRPPNTFLGDMELKQSDKIFVKFNVSYFFVQLNLRRVLVDKGHLIINIYWMRFL